PGAFVGVADGATGFFEAGFAEGADGACGSANVAAISPGNSGWAGAYNSSAQRRRAASPGDFSSHFTLTAAGTLARRNSVSRSAGGNWPGRIVCSPASSTVFSTRPTSRRGLKVRAAGDVLARSAWS